MGYLSEGVKELEAKYELMLDYLEMQTQITGQWCADEIDDSQYREQIHFLNRNLLKKIKGEDKEKP